MSDFFYSAGMGFAFSLGVAAGAAIVGFFIKSAKTNDNRRAEELLRERNEIGITQTQYLLRIAEALEEEA